MLAQLAVGLAAATLALTAHVAGFTQRLEWWAFDARTRWFSAGQGPSDRIAIVAIDDAALRTVQRWPWDRRLLAEAVRELTLAGADVIALDILFDEPQRPRWIGDDDDEPTRLVRDDDELAQAIAEHGRVLLAARFPLVDEDPLHDEPTRDGPVRIDLSDVWRHARAMPGFWRLTDDEALQRLAQHLLPGDELAAARGPGWDMLRLRYQQLLTIRESARTSSVPHPHDGGRWAYADEPRPPIRTLARSAAGIASVSYDSPDADGALRRVPVFKLHGARLWPLLGVSAAALAEADSPAALEVTRNSVRIRAPGGAPGPRVPLARSEVGADPVEGVHIITWPRAARGWQEQFARNGRHAEIPIGWVLEPRRLARAVHDNAAVIDNTVRHASLFLGAPTIDEQYQARAETLANTDPTDPRWTQALNAQRPAWREAAAQAAEYLDMLGGDIDAVRTQDEAAADLLDVLVNRLPDAIGDRIDRGVERIEHAREDLRERAGGKICFIGWTATGAAADFVPTSIDPHTPGVHVHAATANAMLTGYARRPAPVWIDLSALAALGALGAFVGVKAGVVTGPFWVLALSTAWFLIASTFLWQRGMMVAAAVGPALACAAGWLAVVLDRLLVEQRARRRTEERFRSYVSPDVVDILVENPRLDSMAPQKRELTVLFSDIEGFTTIAERLGSTRTAELLAVYLGAMTRILQDTGATLDKYLGDGILAFWGAPIDDPLHATHACQAVIRMLDEVERMNRDGEFGDLRIRVRVGLAAGDLMVGDFGNPPLRSSYTVIGDAANLAARLEAANKIFGTDTLASQRVRQLAESSPAADRFLWRPIGRIVVKGRTGWEMISQLLRPADADRARAQEWIRATTEAVEAYIASDFDRCLAACDTLEQRFGDALLARAYRRSVETARQAAQTDELTHDGFSGTIVLTEK